MDDPQEVSISSGELRSGVKIETGVRHVFVLPRNMAGCLSFVLLSEAGLTVRPHQEFTLTGHGLSLSAETDDQGSFTCDPVEFGEYELKVGDYTYRIPAVHRDDLPHPVHARRGSRDGDWDGPLDSELDGVAPEDADADEDS